jgi:hypothetical protein
VAAPKLKYLLRAQFVDHSDQCYLSVFDSQALTLLKKPVEQVLQEAASSNSSLGDELKKSYFEKSFLLRVRATAQEYKGEVRPRVTVVSAEPLDPVSMGNRLLRKIIERIGKAVDHIDETMKENEEPEYKRVKREEIDPLSSPPMVESKE